MIISIIALIVYSSDFVETWYFVQFQISRARHSLSAQEPVQFTHHELQRGRM